ncbi:hypothetical protein EVAR_35865_1 [Eumeta japonica]|uniref:Uncharacterized protein n=1 Tax=Eumeta variegata TaxID=151549 RepID=A0A4C1WZW3_EUMVA|nr:hypothetical protein EVAR_35865_1 [Eumeta japonica]
MDQNEEKLDQLQDRLEFKIIAPSTATYFPYNDSNRHSTLDIALTKGVLKFKYIPDDIRTTEEIDHAIGALTSHVRTVVEKYERKVPASSDRRKFPPDILELIRAKNAALRRASAYPTPEYRSRARALQREVKARVREFRNESWSDLMEEIKIPQSVLGSYQSAQNRGYTLYPSKT